MVISSLTQDINALPQYRAAAVRALGTVVDSSLISGVERVVKQAMGDRNASVVSSALTTSIHFFTENREAVRRWLPEIQAAFQAGHSKCPAQYHALGLLFLVKQHDRVALTKLVQSIQSGASHTLATTLALQIYNQLLDGEANFMVDMKPFLRMKGKSDLVALEAARVIFSHPEVYSGDIGFAVNILQTYLGSPKAILRFAALRILHGFAAANLQIRGEVSMCNKDIEGLVGDANRNIATLAITTLLKTGREDSVDRLITQIEGYVSEISDEFKITVVDAVRSLGLKFTGKIETMLNFLGTILREDGGLAYKSATVNAICDLLAKVPSARDAALTHLCEFIEDCEFPELTAQILHLLGEEGPQSANPAQTVRYIYNRLILEGALVRSAAVGALSKLATACPALKNGIVSILYRVLEDMDDDVRDRAVLSLKLLEDPKMTKCYLGDESYDLDFLEEQLCDYLRQSEAAFSLTPLDLPSIPILPRVAVFEKAKNSAIRSLGVENDAIVPEPIDSDISNPHTLTTVTSAALGRVEQLKDFGPLLVSSRKTELLTDLESEYVVRCRKYIYREHLVLEFECHNTVRELLLSDVIVNVTVSDDTEYSFKPALALPIYRLPFDEVDSCFIAFAIPNVLDYPEAVFLCSLRFMATDVDPETGKTLGRGTLDEYSIGNVSLGLADFICPRRVIDTESDWASLGEYEVMETLELPSFSTIKEARDAVVGILGLPPPHFGTVDSQSQDLWLTGSLLSTENEGEAFAVKVRFALMINQGVVAEVRVRSASHPVSSRILGTFC